MFSADSMEVLADASGSVTFGWADVGVFYARFGRSLSARTGEAFAARLRSTARIGAPIAFFADARGLESYDLQARRAVLRVVAEQRSLLEQIEILAWRGGQVSPAVVAAIGEPLRVTADPVEFEARLLHAAPHARMMLAAKPESAHRARWPMRRPG